MTDRPRVLVLAHGDLLERIFPERVRQELGGFADPWYNGKGRDLTEDELRQLIPDAQGCVTTWGSPRFSPEVVARADKLRIIAHAAGSVKPYVSPAVFERNIVVTSAARVIARYVGEMALLLTLAALRDLHRYDRLLKEERGWEAGEVGPPDTLLGQRVGLIGFGSTGREFASLLKPFQVELLCYDPHADPQAVEALAGRVVSLEEVLTKCRVISLHAASLTSTRHLLSAERLRTIPDGTVLVNTARGALVDMAALVVELRTGRLKAAMDVFDPDEPLPANHPLRGLPNVILTPHVAGPVPSRYWEMGMQAVRNVRLLLSGQVPPDAITRERLDVIA
jgi:phosphoglycerate dehydrogenase-like enzyme